jgi:hypothetical protein
MNEATSQRIHTIAMLIDGGEQLESLLSDLQQAYSRKSGSVLLYTTRLPMEEASEAIEAGDYEGFMKTAPGPELLIVESVYTIALADEPDTVLAKMADPNDAW